MLRCSRGQQHFAPDLGSCMRGIQLQAYDEVLNSYRSRRAVAEDMWGAALAEKKRRR